MRVGSDAGRLGRYEMKMAMGAVGVGVVGLGVALTACGAGPVTAVQSPAAQTAHSTAAEAAKPAITKTIVRYQTVAAAPSAVPPTVPPAPPMASPVEPSPAAPQQPADQNVTDPWAVVSAYYGERSGRRRAR
jgi:hypothetical protein